MVSNKVAQNPLSNLSKFKDYVSYTYINTPLHLLTMCQREGLHNVTRTTINTQKSRKHI